MGESRPSPRVLAALPARGRLLLRLLVPLLLSGLAALGLLGLAAPASAQSSGPPAVPASPSATASASPSAGAPASGDQAIRGTLANEGERVPGVTVRVEQDGRPVGEAVTDEQGQFRIPVPTPGTYTVVLDTDTLPDGVSLREGVEPQRDVQVRPGANAPALFALGEATAGGAGKLDQAAQLAVDGLRYGLVIAMAAIGLSLIFGTTGLTNFAHGELVTGGALLAYLFNQGLGLNLIPATVLAVLAASVLGALLDRGLWRPLRRRGTGLIAALVVSIGLSLVLRYLYLYLFGGSSKSYAQYAVQGPVTFGPVAIPPRDLWTIGISIVVLVLVGIGLQRTRIGKAARAIADNPSLASSSGIDVERVINVVWAVGAGLAALGGVFLSLTQQVNFINGFNLLLLMFAGVTLGGLGTAFGALVGSLVIGLFTQLSTLYIPSELQQVGALAILILVLIVRPQGILGRRERIG